MEGGWNIWALLFVSKTYLKSISMNTDLYGVLNQAAFLFAKITAVPILLRY